MGAGGWYHIIGFAGFQITECEGGKNIAGVWRKAFSTGPTTASSPGTWASLAVQLVEIADIPSGPEEPRRGTRGL